MRSNKELKSIAKILSKRIISKENKLKVDNIDTIISLLKDEKALKELKIEVSQRKVLLKYFYQFVKNILIENSIELTTAIKLTESEYREKEHQLQKDFEKQIISFKVDPETIAGIKIKNGWNIIDSTIKNKLNILNN